MQSYHLHLHLHFCTTTPHLLYRCNKHLFTDTILYRFSFSTHDFTAASDDTATTTCFIVLLLDCDYYYTGLVLIFSHHDLFFTVTCYLSLLIPTDFIDTFCLAPWKRHFGAGLMTHQQHTFMAYTRPNTAAAPPSTTPESSSIHCNRQCTSTRTFTHISLRHC